MVSQFLLTDNAIHYSAEAEYLSAYSLISLDLYYYILLQGVTYFCALHLKDTSIAEKLLYKII